MPTRFCLGCRKLTRNGSRCPDCQTAYDKRQNARPKGNTTQRGLGAEHRRRANALLKNPDGTPRTDLVCARCGQPGTPDDPLTAGHTTARSQGGGDSPLQPEHLSCGSRHGAQLRRQTP